MGLFGKLFEKKNCDLCGGEIGLLGNRKLEDGNLCKKCAALLSPWFSDRRKSTVEEIKAQLAYREENRNAVASFHITRTLGRQTKVLLDEDNGKFMVASGRSLPEENPDVLDFSQVTGCNLDISENHEEIKRRDEDGNEVSCVPPRYRYRYDFYCTIQVNSPWFDEMRFKLNPQSVEAESLEDSGYFLHSTVGERNVDYQEYKALGEEIKEALTKVREGVRETVAAANAPKTAVTCPWCGATTTPNGQGCCEYCGGALTT